MTVSVPCRAVTEVRLEWGVDGVESLARSSDVLVVVDVLSFSTAVDVALGHGAVVYPARWKDERAEDLANRLGAQLAVPRANMSAQRPFSLSPVSMMGLQDGARLVLPSPNGAAAVLAASKLGATTLIGCLRNASAVASACQHLGKSVAVIAAGERWANGAIRFAYEDLLGAGAIISRMEGAYSPEALAAAAVFGSPQGMAQLPRCLSARELIEMGFENDVKMATELDVSHLVPILRGERIVPHQRVVGDASTP